jgi:hypothetical protein
MRIDRANLVTVERVRRILPTDWAHGGLRACKSASSSSLPSPRRCSDVPLPGRRGASAVGQLPKCRGCALGPGSGGSPSFRLVPSDCSKCGTRACLLFVLPRWAGAVSPASASGSACCLAVSAYFFATSMPLRLCLGLAHRAAPLRSPPARCRPCGPNALLPVAGLTAR